VPQDSVKNQHHVANTDSTFELTKHVTCYNHDTVLLTLDTLHNTRDVQYRDFHYSAGTEICRISDIDVRTVRSLTIELSRLHPLCEYSVVWGQHWFDWDAQTAE